MEENKYKKLLSLLSQETDLNQESKEQEQTAAFQALLGTPPEASFEPDFTDQLMQQIQKEEQKEDELTGRIVHLFKRVAISGAAAILFLLSYSFYSEGSLAPDALLGFSEIEESALDYTYNYNYTNGDLFSNYD